MRVFDVESGALHGFEHRLYLSSLSVGFGRVFRFVERNDDLQFRFPIVSLDPTSRQIALLSFHVENVADEVGLTVLQVIENPEHLHIVAAFRIECPKIIPYSDVVS